MESLIFRRLIACSLDYMIIVLYAILLYQMSIILNLKELEMTPISGQLIGFLSLTLPVFLYFYLSEKGRRRATIGKRIMNISVCPKSDIIKPRILKRNILKFLPWEIAHTGVHWIVFYTKHENDVPFWVWILLILPQIIMVIYLFSIIISKGKSSIYDRIAFSKIKLTRSSEHKRGDIIFPCII